MSFGMERKEIESKVLEELSKPRGGVAHFNKYTMEAIAEAISSVIIENNTKIQYSLGEAGLDFK